MAKRPPPTILDRIRAAGRAFMGVEESGWRTLGGPSSVGGVSNSGMNVTDETALRVTAVLSCVKVIAESISTLPLQVFERLPNGDKRAAAEHPVSTVLHLLASDETTAQSLRETLCAHVLLRGNAYAQIVRDGGGDVRELWPIPPGTLRPFRRTPTARLSYEISETGRAPTVLSTEQVWRVPGLVWSGVEGLSPIGYAREAVGLAMALERNTGSTLRNGARIGGIVSYPEVLDDEEYAARQQALQETLSGADNAGKTFIADGGAKFEKVGMTLEDMQFLELKKFQIAEIARLFRVPLHMLFDDKAQPRANMEQASLEFVVYTLRPWLVRFEQTIARDLLLPSERARYFAEHNVAGLLRGDFAARMAGYAQGRQWGWWSVNDIRRLENLNGIGPDGDVYLQPSNMVRAGADALAGQ